MATDVTQRNNDRNQSTADYQKKKIFIYNNRYQNAVYHNNSGASATVSSGSLVLRETATPANIIPAIAGATLANVIGILSLDGSVTLADAGTVNASYAVSGDIDAGELTFPSGVSLDTVVGSKLLRDVLTDLGFKLVNVQEQTNFDN